MIKIKTECLNCIHHDVCKYPARYEDCYKDLELNYSDNGKEDDFLSIEVSCVHFWIKED